MAAEFEPQQGQHQPIMTLAEVSQAEQPKENFGQGNPFEKAQAQLGTSTPELKDSGKRQEYKSGAVRDAEEFKGMLELNPGWADFAYGWIMESGAIKYAARNWEKGMPISRYIRSAKNHLNKYLMGFRDEPHLWQAFWNIGCAIHVQIGVYIGLYPKELYDLPNHTPTGASGIQAPIMGMFERLRIHKFMGWDKPEPAKGVFEH